MTIDFKQDTVKTFEKIKSVATLYYRKNFDESFCDLCEIYGTKFPEELIKKDIASQMINRSSLFPILYSKNTFL